MKCPSCKNGDLRIFTNGNVLSVKCPECLYVVSLAEAISKALKYKYLFGAKGDNDYTLYALGASFGQIGFSSFANATVNGIKIAADQPSQIADFVAELKKLFPAARISIYQKGIDPGYNGCPICKSKKLQRTGIGAHLLTTDCDDFQVSLMDMAASLIASTGLEVFDQTETFFTFGVENYPFLYGLTSLFWNVKPTRKLVGKVELRSDETSGTGRHGQLVIAVSECGHFPVIFKETLAHLQEQIKVVGVKVTQVY